MKIHSKLGVLLAGMTLLTASALGQSTVLIQGRSVSGDVPPELAAAMAAAMANANAGGAESEAATKADDEPVKDTERLKKLKKLTYDRRPSAILKAWSTPLEELDFDDDGDGESDDAADSDADAGAGDETAAAELDAGAVAQLTALGYLSTPPAAPSTGGATPTVTLTPAATPATGAAPASSAVPSATPDEPVTDEAAGEGGEDASAEAAEAAAKKAADDAEAKRKAEEEAKQKEREAKLLEHELKVLQRNVTLGEWDAVTAYFAGVTEAEAEAGYVQLLKSLSVGPKKPQSPFVAYAESNVFAPEDLVGVITSRPEAFEVEAAHVKQLGKLIQKCLKDGFLIEQVLDAFGPAVAVTEFASHRRVLAMVLIHAGHAVEAGPLLPSPEEAREGNDREALNMLSRYYLAMESKEDVDAKSFLQQAWDVTQAVLADGEVEDEDKEEALRRAVDIAPRLREELGQAWLDESFTERPERGMEILRTIGTVASEGLLKSAKKMPSRQAGLELQTTAAEALLAASPERAVEWSGTLTLLATNWLREADVTYQFDTSTSQAPQMERDVYGNFYYYNWSRQPPGNQPTPILTGDVLELRPSDAWLDHIDPSLLPKISIITAKLLLKVGEEADAFPYIERLAATHPEHAEELVAEFLSVWIDNHDPNDNSRRSSYVYFYGYEQRADGIPLTRSKQERNLAELAEWVVKLRALPIDGIDEAQLTAAFVTAHSKAEVYRLETIESVFGSMDALEPATLASLAQRMRANLVGVWRDPAVQKESKTNRRQRDLRTEVLRGYEVAKSVVERGLGDHADDWELLLAQASIMHDELNFQKEIKQDSGFASDRSKAFESFAAAADAYVAKLPEIEQEDESAQVFTTWYYASLGACDLNAIDNEMVQATGQVPRIREALEGLPEEARDRHVGDFSNVLFTRMGNVNPAVKYRYVRSGLAIVGDHERARYAQEVFDYYEDLVTEITLDTRIDGNDIVGHDEPFGLFVDLRHTREIEREAGGFGKYLVNQANQSFGWNYGRPTENYRDKFEDGLRESLDEHFEVLSVTFNHPDSHSRAVEQYGWRVSPYAYLLLKPRGPQVDSIPSLHLDLDFLDTTGYAVLPVESSPVPIDAVAARGDARPFRDVEIVQTLDERQAKDGRLLLEVSARGLGLIPELESLLELGSEGFEVGAVEDQGVSVAEFEQDSDDTAIVSERSWVVQIEAADGLAELPEQFTFGRPRVEGAELVHQRYEDADLAQVEPVVALTQVYGERDLTPWWLGGLGGLVLLGALIAIGRSLAARRVQAGESRGRFPLPDEVSAFTVMGLLRRIDAENGLANGHREELRAQITRLERYYFEEQDGEAPDVRGIAETWVARAN